MSVLVVGSVAIDSIATPWGKADRVLGGSATYASLAARLWSPTALVAVVGRDFPSSYRRLFDKKGIGTQGLFQAEGRTFTWKGRYDQALQASTLFLDLGVFKTFDPVLPQHLKRVRTAFLGNIHPSLQWRVLQQLISPKLTACDSRDDWIKSDRRGLLAILKAVDLVFLNDGEARLLTGLSNLIQATRALARYGPRVAVVKKGEHGVLAASRDAFFSLPGYPISRVVDPTGAGDAFAGAALGYLTIQKRVTWKSLCQALIFGSVAASLTIEAFGPVRLAGLTKADLNRRVRSFAPLTRTLLV